MEALLLERIVVGEEELQALARRRGEAVKTHLSGQAQLPAERLLVAAPGAATAEEKAPLNRVQFGLK